jgi:signal transduction histidine kinase
LGRIIGNLGKVYIKQSDFSNAEKYLNIAIEHDYRNEDYGHLPTTYALKGTLAAAQNNYEDALNYYELSDSIYKLSDDVYGVHLNLINRSIAYRNQGRYELAISSCRKALPYLRRQDFSDGIIAAWQGLAAVYALMHLPEKALIYYDSCMTLAINTNDLNRQQVVLGDILFVYLQIEDYKNAFAVQENLRKINDSIFKLEKTELINNLLLKYEKEKDQIRILHLENENLEQARQQNLIIFIGLGVLLILLFLLFFANYKSRKNKIIAAQKLKQFEEEKKLLAARFIVEGQEEERKRVATAIHDSLGVLLSSSKMSITAIKDNNPENKALIEKATRFLDEASGEMRKISHNMMPGLLTKLGLYEALEDLFESLNDLDKIDACMEVVGPMQRLPENTEIMIYRIMQELVNNTLKHAKASRIDLTIIVHPDQLDISYSDDGIGFNRDETLDRKTMGIQNIRSRVKFLDGNVCIDTSPGKGTVYRINVPV